MAGRSSAIVEFLKGTGSGSRGDTVLDILAGTDRVLEERHDYIQWLFPLDEASSAVPGSPILSTMDKEAIRASEPARSHILSAAERMRIFYTRNRHWLTAYDHNHRRITRIIKSLRLLVGPPEAEAFKRAITDMVEKAGNPVNPRSRSFWNRA